MESSSKKWTRPFKLLIKSPWILVVFIGVIGLLLLRGALGVPNFFKRLPNDKSVPEVAESVYREPDLEQQKKAKAIEDSAKRLSDYLDKLIKE